MAHPKTVERESHDTPAAQSQASPPGEAPASTRPPQHAAAHPLARLRADMDRLFDDLWSGRRWPLSWAGEDMPARLGGASGMLEVRTDVAETEDAIELTAEMPGVAEDDVSVELSAGMLTIRGEKKQDSEEKKKDWYRCERSYGAFQRSFAVPDSVDADKIHADFDKGVLHVVLPKKPEAKAEAKRIPIGGGKRR